MEPAHDKPGKVQGDGPGMAWYDHVIICNYNYLYVIIWYYMYLYVILCNTMYYYVIICNYCNYDLAL